jgi:hypothetical protein
MTASKGTQDAVKQMMRRGDAQVGELPDAKPTRQQADPEAPLRERARSAQPQPDESLSDVVVRTAKEDADVLEEGLESFVVSLSRALEGKEDFVVGKTKIDLDTTIDVAIDGSDGFRQVTVRELLEEAKMADDSEKAVKTCLI